MSDHFNGRRFFNPAFPEGRNFWHVLRWAATRKKERWPKWVEDRAYPEPPAEVPGAIAVTFVNHSTFLLQLDGVRVLTDPIWSERCSPLRWAGPRRVRRPGLPFERLPEVQVVLVSHNHYDHMDVPTLQRLQQRFDPLFVTSLGNRRFLRSCGLRRVEELDWWQSLKAAGLDVTLTPAQHFSGRGLFDRHRTLWGGFALRSGGRSVYFAGDSAYGEHFRAIRHRLGPFDVSLLPIGAYEPRWFMGPAHVNPEEAVRAHLDLAPTQSLAMHFGTFQLTDEAIDEPLRALEEGLARHGVAAQDFRALGFGETLLVPGTRPQLQG